MMEKPLRVLFVEDSEDDALLTVRVLKKGGYDPVYERVEDAGAMRKALQEKTWDVVLCDYQMPEFNGSAAIALLKDTGIDIPLIIVSGAIGDETAVECMRSGAHDYVMKKNLSRLASAVKRELKDAELRNQHKLAEQALQESEERYRNLFENANEAIFVVQNGKLVFLNPMTTKGIGYSKEELMARSFIDFVHPDDQAMVIDRHFRRIKGETISPLHSFRVIQRDGSIRWVEANAVLMNWQGKTAALAFLNDITERKRNEIVLQKSEEKYRSLVESISDAIYEIDSQGIVIYISPVIKNIMGYEPAEIIGKNFIEFVNEDDRSRLIERFIGLSGGKESPLEYRLNSKSGDIRWVRTRTSPVMEDGSFKGARGTLMDVTDRRNAEEALRKRNEYIEKILDNMPIGLAVNTIDDGVARYLNNNFTKIYGWPNGVLTDVNNFFENVYPGAEGKELKARVMSDMNSGDPERMFWDDLKITTSTGEHRYISARNIPILEQNLMISTVWDTTRLHESQEALRQSEEKYRDIFNKTLEGIYQATPEGLFNILNPAFARICGYASPEEMIEKVTDIANQLYANPEDRLRFQKLIAAQREVNNFQVQFKHPTKGLIWVSIHAQSVHDEQGNICCYDGTIEDITERKCLEEELRSSHQQLRALATHLQQIREEERVMISREIHDEMGGGLTGLKMDLLWLLRKIDDADPADARVALMDRIHTSNALIDHLIQVVRRITTDLRPSVLDDLGLIAALEWQLLEFTSRTEISHEFATTFEYINMEKDTAVAVFRIFQEALTNVVRHARATKLAVLLREGEQSLFGDDDIVLEIRDNGRGIKEGEILNPESLGLLGMKERALTFAGELSIRGEPGGGTTLILKIPRKQ